MKRFLFKTSCILLCLISVGFTACKKTPDLYQKGVEITALMGKMVVSEQYLKMIGLETVKMEAVQAKDYDSPTRAYQISAPNFDSLYEEFGNINETLLNELSDELKEQIEAKFSFYTILNDINFNCRDRNALVISTSLYAEKTFDGKIPSTIIYLYTFETGKPIVVVFEPFGNEHFTAKGYFLFADDVSTLSKARELFEHYGCNVKNAR